MSLNPITREEKFLAKAGGEDVGELKPITRREKFLDRIAGGGGGGADLLETVGGDTLTWDGNTDGKTGIDVLGNGEMLFYCISNNTPTIEDFANGGSIVSTTMNAEFTSNEILVEDKMLMIGQYAMVISEDNYTDSYGIYYEKKGVYFYKSPSETISSLTINGYTGFTKTALKEEYLPSTGTLIDLDNPNVELTTSDGMFIVTNIPFTPVLNRLKRGESVVVKMEGCYFTPIMYVDEGGGVTIMINTGNETIVIILQTP